MKSWKEEYASKITTFDELIEKEGRPRTSANAVCKDIAKFAQKSELRHRQASAEIIMEKMGITFNVYNKDEGNVDRVWPFDIIPRVISDKDWKKVEKGLVQRLKALNLFIDDIYNKKRIIKDKVFPEELLKDAPYYLKECIGITPPHKIWCHISGCDLIRDADGIFRVLEDNLRIPSGVSYVLENRFVLKKVFPELFENTNIKSVADYPDALFKMLRSVSKRRVKNPEIVVLTPGIYNSAYFEHSFLAQQMGAELVEGRDLFVDKDNCVYMRTIEGPKRVDVIYRRVDDDFLDPEVFRKDSALGVPGLMRAWKNHKVTIVNAPGTGVADDKVVYAFVPKMIKYYLKEEPLLESVPTYLCYLKEDREYVLKNLNKLVVKPANASGGYGILIGPKASKTELEKCARQIKKAPRNFIAQPLINLSTVPTLTKKTIEPRHVDLRPFILTGAGNSYVTPGGLTRVALKRGSFIVNSSQGGGSKDTWVVRD